MGNSVHVSGRNAIEISARQHPLVPHDNGAVVKIGALLLSVYVFIIYSRALELLGVGTATAIILTLLVPCIIFSGNLLHSINDHVGHLLLAYAAWFCLAVAMSSWRGGSFDILLHRTGRALLLYVAIVALVRGKREIMRLVWAIALGNLFIVFRAITYGTQQAGRLVVGGGTFGDPNELALYAIFGLFLWALIGLRLPFVLRFVPLIAMGMCLVTFGKAGSRGGLVALVAAGMAHFWSSSLGTKLRVVTASVVLMVLAMFLLPGYLRSRFLTFFSVDTDSQYAEMLEGNDVASTVGRQELAWQAFRLTLQDPLFGVGPGEFGNAVYHQHKTGEDNFINRASHNSYLQISSEAGIPAALLFISALAACFLQKPKYATAFRKSNTTRAGPSSVANDSGKTSPECARIIHYTRVTLVFVAAFGVTLSFAYDDIFMIAMALLTAATNVASNNNAAAAMEVSRQGPMVMVPR